VGAFLRENPQFAVEEIDSKLPHDKKKYGLQFLPDRAYGAGFYIAKLKRL
jgi:16S rRNA C967 or C1407 C5-methylase (RsmB/RsmF family)